MLVEAASYTVELEVHMGEGLLSSGKPGREAIDEEEEREVQWVWHFQSKTSEQQQAVWTHTSGKGWHQ